MSRINEIRERLKSVPDGFWLNDSTEDIDWAVFVPETGQMVADCWSEAIASFIAHAPDDLRWLLEEVDRLGALLEYEYQGSNETRETTGRQIRHRWFMLSQPEKEDDDEQD